MIRRFFRYPLRALDSVIDRLMAVIGAVACSQAPGFISHYLQRLGGHVTEARLNVASWQAIADDTTGGSLRELMSLYQSSGATEVVAAGRKCAADIDRLHHLQEAFTRIIDAPVWRRAFDFVRHAESEIAYETLESYVPNVPVDIEGLVYAACGLLIGFGLYQGAKGSIRLAAAGIAIRRLEKRKTAKGEDYASRESDDVGGVEQAEPERAADRDIEGGGGGDGEAGKLPDGDA